MSSMTKQPSELLPPGIADEFQLTPKTVEMLRKLEQYDLSRITENFIDKGPAYSPEQIWPIRLHFGKADIEIARTLEREFKRFIALSLMRPRQIYAPSGPVDMYWHFFVLHTREYERFCDDIWGASSSPGAYPESVAKAYATARGGESHGMSEEIDLVPQSLCDSLPANVAGSLKALRDYDLSYFTEHLVDTGRMFAPEQKYPLIAHFGKADIEVCRMLEREFRKFVALTLIEPGITFAPPGPVDMYWHFMILHTKEYKQFCEKIWGAFQHHPRGSLADTD